MRLIGRVQRAYPTGSGDPFRTTAQGGKVSSSALFEDGFEGTGAGDGVHIHDYNSWGGASGTTVALSSTTPHPGSTYCSVANGTDTYVYPHSFTQQTTGTFTVRFWVYLPDITGTRDILDVGNTWSWDTSFATLIGHQAQHLRFYSTSGWNYEYNVFSATTWQKIEIEFNVTNHTFNIWIDGTQISTTGIAFKNDVSPDTISLHDNTSSADIRIDDIKIYSGARDGS